MMGKRVAVPVLAVLILGLGLNSGAWAQAEAPTPEAAAEGVGAATILTVHGKIVKVDKAHKLVTLEGPAENKVTIVVMNPDSLKAAKVGAHFVARFYEVVTIRKKKPGESIAGASLSHGVWTANPGGVERRYHAHLIRILVNIDAIDEAKGTVTIKGLNGSTETVKPKDPQILKRLKVGDKLVITHYHGVAVSLQPESGAGAS